MTFDRIKTPLDSKKYLFQDISFSAKSVDISDSKEIYNRALGMGKKV
jgi:hypothetical protein